MFLSMVKGFTDEILQTRESACVANVTRFHAIMLDGAQQYADSDDAVQEAHAVAIALDIEVVKNGGAHVG